MAVLQALIAMIGRAAAVNREPQLLAHTEEHTMTPSAQYPSSRPAPAAVAPEALSTTQLVGQIASKATLLLREEVELARVELKKDVAAEIATAKRLGIAAVVGISAVNLFLVAIVFALTPYVAGWVAAGAIGGLLLLTAALVGALAWQGRVEQPLERTRKTLKEDVQWAKDEMA
ncbi:MAG: phage holin family protein [Deltaproteobacteria bacterium]|nr:MAG: phage holin family protein [Deltaproteobacteria bacterium]